VASHVFHLICHSLWNGIGLISVAPGCFGIAEIVKNLDDKSDLTPFTGEIKLMPTWPEFKIIIPSALRGSVVGSVLGVLVGVLAALRI
jgi:TctA family transporter